MNIVIRTTKILPELARILDEYPHLDATVQINVHDKQLTAAIEDRFSHLKMSNREA